MSDNLHRTATMDRVTSYTTTWPAELQDAFWAAVNAPTYDGSALKTLAFATKLTHELAEQIRAENRGSTGITRNARTQACRAHGERLADFIDPEVP